MPAIVRRRVRAFPFSVRSSFSPLSQSSSLSSCPSWRPNFSKSDRTNILNPQSAIYGFASEGSRHIIFAARLFIPDNDSKYFVLLRISDLARLIDDRGIGCQVSCVVAVVEAEYNQITSSCDF